MATRVIEPSTSPGPMVDGVPCRQEEICLRLTDGSVWVLDQLMIPLGQKSVSMRSAAWFLKQQRALLARGRKSCWRLAGQAAPVRRLAESPR